MTGRQQQHGAFYGVGVGPGDPELITIKARRIIENADIVTYLSNADGHSMARNIARSILARPVNRKQQQQAICMPMCESREAASTVYDTAAANIKEALAAGRSVVFLCQGDPLFFGSFAYLLERLQGGYPVHIVPGISSINASAARLCIPLALQTETFMVISGRQSDEQIFAALSHFDNIAILKAGRRRQRIIAEIQRAKRTRDAYYVEFAGQENERVVYDIEQLSPGQGPYFSLFLIIADRHKPEAGQ